MIPIIPIVAIWGIVVLEYANMKYLHKNGKIFTLSIASISGLGGYGAENLF